MARKRKPPKKKARKVPVAGASVGEQPHVYIEGGTIPAPKETQK